MIIKSGRKHVLFAKWWLLTIHLGEELLNTCWSFGLDLWENEV